MIRNFANASGDAALPNEFRENLFDENPSLFHSIANETIQRIVTRVEALETELDGSGWDIKEADGVCEIKLGRYGCYVINKQTPNKQIWWSSPVSGPKRFNYDMAARSWRNTRDGGSLLTLLESELTALLGVPVTFEKD